MSYPQCTATLRTVGCSVFYSLWWSQLAVWFCPSQSVSDIRFLSFQLLTSYHVFLCVLQGLQERKATEGSQESDRKDREALLVRSTALLWSHTMTDFMQEKGKRKKRKVVQEDETVFNSTFCPLLMNKQDFSYSVSGYRRRPTNTDISFKCWAVFESTCHKKDKSLRWSLTSWQVYCFVGSANSVSAVKDIRFWQASLLTLFSLH